MPGAPSPRASAASEPRPSPATVLLLRAIQTLDRARLAALARRHPGLEVHEGASTNLAHARFVLAPGARLRIGRGVRAERERHAVHFHVGPGAEMVIGEGTWLRAEVQAIHLVAEAGARLVIGPRCFINGCHLSAKQSVTIGADSMIGMGTRVFDSDQHDLDLGTPERTEPVVIGERVWVASDATVLRGVRIGDHCVVGTRALLARSLPPHTLAYGVPAEPRGTVGDRQPALEGKHG